MLFNSTDFWIFFAIVFVAFHLAPQRLRNPLLLVVSYIFYAFWDWRFLGLIVFSTCVDFACALAIADSRVHRKRWLLVSIITNLGVLGFLKYFNFFADSLQALALQAGMETSMPVLQVALPVGISFYTFQSMGYTIDVYRGVAKPVGRLLDLALYVAYFPQLVAGPIERSSRLLAILGRDKFLTSERLRRGAWLILFGLLKKVVLADNMAPVVNAVFDAPEPAGALPTLLAVYAFALQIYGDFSGYTDIARGVSLWLGIDLVLNFRRPYFCASPREFWRRWHISLSQWLRDYLYIPLGGNRGGPILTQRNLMLTMLLGGLWHGASWMFVIWGGLHGTYLVVHLLLSKTAAFRSLGTLPSVARLPLSLAAGVVWFHLVCLAWVFFRAQSLSSARQVLVSVWAPLETTAVDTKTLWLMAVCAAPVLLVDLWAEVFERRHPRASEGAFLATLALPLRAVVYALLVALVAVAGAPQGAEFIYFQF
jgi:D-alanyl-lipoteichoic acid acyltransferase DltB (MBOAT superfamily)